MTGDGGPAYTYDHVVGDDGSVEFSCTTDPTHWPWLVLPSSHPIFIQTFNYFVSVECSMARQARDPSKWTALTWMDWEMGESCTTLPVRGRIENRDNENQLAFEKCLYDAEDRLVYRAAGKGVVFRNRNFESWRQKSKDQLDSAEPPNEFRYAGRDEVGALDGETALISPLDLTGTTADGLVTDANGMPPGSTYLVGSGDHVNAVHIGEVGRQFCAQRLGDPDVQFTGGEINFTRYVEMNVPFQVQLLAHDGPTIRLMLKQANKPCAELLYRMQTARPGA